MKHGIPVVAAFLGVAALGTGCGADPAVPVVTPPATTTSTTAATTVPTTVPTTALTTTTPAVPLLADQPMAARDGTDTARCPTGDCEVLVPAGAVIGFGSGTGPATLVIGAVTPEGVSWEVRDDAGFTSRSVEPVTTAGEFMTYAGVHLSLVAMRGGECVVRLTRG